MTRIFDALRKADATRSGSTPAPVTPLSSAPATGPVAVPRSQGLGGPAALQPVVARAALPEAVLREMSTLRVSVESALPDRNHRTVLLVSAQGGEGTTTVAAQFVLALASDPRTRVLFVDACASSPALDTAPGASGPLASVFVPSTESGAAHNIDLMPVPPADRANRFYAPGDLELRLEPLAPNYDWIVIDGPPVLFASESSALAALADGVLVVVEAGRTKKPVLGRAVELLHKAGARVLGSVLNRRQLEIPEFLYRRI